MAPIFLRFRPRAGTACFPHWRRGLGVLLLVLALAPAAVRGDDPPPTPQDPPGPLPAPPSAEEAQADKERAAIEKLFLDLGTYISRDQRPQIATLFDTKAMHALLVQGGFDAKLTAPQKEAFAKEIQVAFPQIVAQRQVVAPYATYEILKLLPIDGGRRLVLLRHRDLDGWITNIRWWLVPQGDGWRIQDFEDLDVALRFSALTGAAAVARITGQDAFRQAVTALQAGIGFLREAQFEEAWKILQKIPPGKMPRMLEASRRFMLGLVHLNLKQHQWARRRFDEAEALNADMPILDRLRAVSFNRVHDHRKALAYARRYTQRVGADAQVQLEIGRAWKGLGETEEAIQAFARGVDEHPDEPELIAELAMALPLARKPIAIDHYRNLPSALRYFEFIADHVTSARDATTLRMFTRAFTSLSPGHPVSDYYEAQALLIEGRPKDALTLFERALGRVKDERILRPYLEAWLDAMLMDNRHVEALTKSPDPRFALTWMGWDLSRGDQADKLQALVAAGRRELKPAPPELDFFELETLFLRGSYTQILKPLARLRLRLLENVDKERQRRDLWELLWEVEDRLIRSLLRTRQYGIAGQYAKQIHERDEDPLYLGFVAAAEGKSGDATRWLDQSLSLRLDPTMVFGDEDVGKLLDGPAYADLRKRHKRQ